MEQDLAKAYVPAITPRTHCQEDPRTNITDDEQKKYNEVLQHFSEPEYVLPGVEDSPALKEIEKFWLSRECLLRYLVASKWKVSVAKERLEATLKWRRDFGLYDTVTAEHVEPENVTGKQIIFGYDTLGKPAMYMLPSRQNTNEPTRQIQQTVFLLERCIDLMGPGVETLALLINFADRGKNPSMATSRTVLNILQDHYPERLGFALIINVPFLINAFFKVIMPFVDPITRAKVRFNPEVIKEGIFNPDMVMNTWGGNIDFIYEHEKYWPAFISMCEQRRASWLDKWKALGGTIGIKEWDYKDGANEAVAQNKDAADKAELNKTVEAVAIVEQSEDSPEKVNGVPTVDEKEIEKDSEIIVVPVAVTA